MHKCALKVGGGRDQGEGDVALDAGLEVGLPAVDGALHALGEGGLLRLPAPHARAWGVARLREGGRECGQLRNIVDMRTFSICDIKWSMNQRCQYRQAETHRPSPSNLRR